MGSFAIKGISKKRQSLERGVASGEVFCFVLFKYGRLFQHVFNPVTQERKGGNARVMSLSR